MSGSRSQQDALVRDLRNVIDSHARLLRVPTARGDVRRECTAQILQEVASFLISWQGLDPVIDFPSGIIRDSLGLIFIEVGPGDAQLRCGILETLSALTSADCRQVLLDALPWTMPLEADDLEEATQQVLDTLRGILMDDVDALLPVLGCLSALPLSERGRTEAWNVALASLPVVSELDLPVLGRTLLRHVTSSEDASRALVALRAECRLVQHTSEVERGDHDPIPLVAHVLLGALQDCENGALLIVAYLDILRSLPNESEEDTFIILDAVAILSLYQDPTYKDDLSEILDTLLEAGTFPFHMFKLLLDTLCHHQRPGESSVLYDQVAPCLIAIGIFLLLAPLRNEVSADKSLALTREFLMDLYHKVDRDRQEELVRCLLHLSEEVSWLTDDDIPWAKRDKRRRFDARVQPRNGEKHRGIIMTIDAVHRIIQDLAIAARGVVARYKHILVERLTSVSTSGSASDVDVRTTQQLCSILACLVEPMHAESGSGSGIDASEVMILLQKLLFTSSYYRVDRPFQGEEMGDVSRVVRGLLLATELVQSPYLILADKDCIQQWVQRILLPSTRRIVDPAVGRHGLKFLEASSKLHLEPALQGTTPMSSQANDSNLFNHIKLILANTGLIQMLAPYLERRKSSCDVVLGYSKIPKVFVTTRNGDNNGHPGTAQKSRKRDMVFCVSSFLRNTTLPHPTRWSEMSLWVFDLVNTYLTLGRNIAAGWQSNGGPNRHRSKWLPDGWLEACIELPSFNISIDKATKKHREIEEWLNSQLGHHDVAETSIKDPPNTFQDVVNCIMEGKNPTQMLGQADVFLHFALACSLSISLSAAVLCNSYEHYIGLSTESEAQSMNSDIGAGFQNESRQRELRKLMQYQLMKIYDLKRKCLLIGQILEYLPSTIIKVLPPSSPMRSGRKRGSRDLLFSYSERRNELASSDDDDVASKEDDADCVQDSHMASMVNKRIETMRNASLQLLLMISQFFCTPNFINPTILWTTLADSEDDRIFMDYLKNTCLRSEVYVFLAVIELRREVADHLSEVIRQCKVEYPRDNPTFQQAFARCIQITSNISIELPRYRKGVDLNSEDFGANVRDKPMQVSVAAIGSLLSSYFRLLSSVLLSAHQESRSAKQAGEDSTLGPTSILVLPEFIALLETNLFKVKSLAAENGALTVVDPTSQGDSIARAFTALLGHLQICEDANAALEIIEMISILAWHREDDLLELALKASWRVLHTVYSNPRSNKSLQNGLLLPYAFLGTMHQVSLSLTNKVQKRKVVHLVETVLSATIAKTVLNGSGSKVFIAHSSLTWNLLAIWALMVRLSPITSNKCEYLSKLIDAIELYLRSLNESIAESRKATRDAGTVGISKKLSNNRNQQIVSSIAGLSGSSYVVYFELLLHMSVATLAVAPHSRWNLDKAIGSGSRSPYQHLQDLTAEFVRMVDLYTLKFKFFPRRAVTTVLGACQHMLSLTVYHVDGCVQWRNAQPLLSAEEKKAGVHDSGSIQYLDNLLQFLVSHGAGRIVSLCEFIRSQALGTTNTTGQGEGGVDLRGEDWIFRSHHKKVTSLMVSAQKVVAMLKNIASTHNLACPQILAPGFFQPTKPVIMAVNHPIQEEDRGFHELITDDVAASMSKIDRKDCRQVTNQIPADEAGVSEMAMQSYRKRQLPVINDEEDYEWGEDNDDNDAQDSVESSDSFGISGNWGHEDDSDDGNDSSSCSMELQVTEIIKVS